ncbi:MAG TPA: hypothetical protein VGB12_13335 [bacterium]
MVGLQETVGLPTETVEKVNELGQPIGQGSLQDGYNDSFTPGDAPILGPLPTPERLDRAADIWTSVTTLLLHSNLFAGLDLFGWQSDRDPSIAFNLGFDTRVDTTFESFLGTDAVPFPC